MAKREDIIQELLQETKSNEDLFGKQGLLKELDAGPHRRHA